MRLLLVGALLLCATAAVESKPPLDTLGIPPQDEAYYRGGVIKCRDGSGRFSREQLNDDFCDCPDGTDEPGTSACPEAKFYCKNAGHTPVTIFSSRVNDGICDCCDGSDEYDSNITCKNTCWEAGKAAREKLKKKVATYKSGVVIRNQEVERAKEAYAKDEAELAKLKGEEKILQGLVDKLKEQKRLIEKAEEEERLRKEKEEKRIKEAEKQAADEKGTPDASPDVDSKETHDHVQEDENKVAEEHDVHATDHDNHATDHDNHAAESGASVEQGSVNKDDISVEAGTLDELLHKESAVPTLEKDHSSDNPEGLSREELGRMVASRWTGESVSEVSKDDKKGHEDEQEIPEPAKEALEDELEIPEPAEENYDGYHSEVEDDRHKYEDEEFDHESEDEYVDDHDEHVESYKSDDDQKDLTEPGHASWLDKIQQTVQNVFQKFNFFRTPVDLSEASRVRKEYDDANSKLSKIQSKISNLAEKLKHDFGKDKEFYSFYDQCFETKEGKYTYKVCAYKKASQAEGHSSTNLG
ncbi:Glucosidase 2 subunit beta [Zea mays]|nr:Glucosidase 2 subunit beta [Zea mays]